MNLLVNDAEGSGNFRLIEQPEYNISVNKKANFPVKAKYFYKKILF